MKKRSELKKKEWKAPVIIFISDANVQNGSHPSFREQSPGATPFSFVITKNTPLHKVYHTSIAGWNFADVVS